MHLRPQKTADYVSADEAPDELRSGSMLIRLAADEAEIRAAQELRYRVFYDEMHAQPTQETLRLKRDFDRYDEVADHLLVLDEDRGPGADRVVGTYRLIRRSAAASRGGFYTADEFDIWVLTKRTGEVLELGRSCVHPDYRTRRVLDLLWRGIAAYLFRFDIELMFGCGSFPGADPERLKMLLSFLYHDHLAPMDYRPSALPERRVEMNRMPRAEIDARRAVAELPPLIKGYLRLGGFVGDGAVIDEQFNTTDVCVVVVTDSITDTYRRYYSRRSKDSQAA